MAQDPAEARFGDLRVGTHAPSGSDAVDGRHVNDAIDTSGDKGAGLRLQHRSKSHVDTSSQLAAESVGYGIDANRAAVVLFRAAIPDVGRDRPIDDPVHHHVVSFRVDPYIDAFDLENLAGLDPDRERRIGFHRELEGLRAQHLAPLTVRSDAIPQVVGGDDQLRIVDVGLPQAIEQVLHHHRDDADVLAFLTIADGGFSPVSILDHSVEEENALGGAARGGEERGDVFGVLDAVAGFLEHLSNNGLLGALAASDHAGGGFDHPAAVAAPLQGGRPELLDQHDLATVTIEDQGGDRVPSFKDEKLLLGAHGPVELTMGDRDLVELEESVEYASLAANDDRRSATHPTAPCIRQLRSNSAKSRGVGNARRRRPRAVPGIGSTARMSPVLQAGLRKRDLIGFYSFEGNSSSARGTQPHGRSP